MTEQWITLDEIAPPDRAAMPDIRAHKSKLIQVARIIDKRWLKDVVCDMAAQLELAVVGYKATLNNETSQFRQKDSALCMENDVESVVFKGPYKEWVRG